MASGEWYVYVQTFFDQFRFVAKTAKRDDADRVANLLRERIRSESHCACLVRVQLIGHRKALLGNLDNEITRNLERGRKGDPAVEAFAARIAADILSPRLPTTSTLAPSTPRTSELHEPMPSQATIDLQDTKFNAHPVRLLAEVMGTLSQSCRKMLNEAFLETEQLRIIEARGFRSSEEERLLFRSFHAAFDRPLIDFHKLVQSAISASHGIAVLLGFGTPEAGHMETRIRGCLVRMSNSIAALVRGDSYETDEGVCNECSACALELATLAVPNGAHCSVDPRYAEPLSHAEINEAIELVRRATATARDASFSAVRTDRSVTPIANEGGKPQRAPELKGVRISRPDFIETNDIRATSDSAWLALRNLRRQLLDWTPESAEHWAHRFTATLLECERHKMVPAGRASIAVLPGNDHEATQVAQSRPPEGKNAVDGRLWMPDAGSWIDLDFASFLAGNAAHVNAIEWTEQWMIYRQRQLCDMKDSESLDSTYLPASSFGKTLAARLRMAAGKSRKGKKVSTRRIDGVVCYSLADAKRWWPRDVPKDL